MERLIGLAVRTFVVAGLVVCSASADQAPSIESVLPSTARAGGGDFIVRVHGSGFTSSTVLRWNGSERVTAVVAPDSLTAMILGSDVAQPGEGRLTAYDPGSGASQAFALPVRAGPSSADSSARAANPVPVVEGITPSSAAAGRGALKIRVRGRGFTPLSVVRWRAAARHTRYVDAGTLEAQLLAEDFAGSGQGMVSVRNPLPGGGVSAPLPFPVAASRLSGRDKPRVYPNPWSVDRHEGTGIVFEHLSTRSTIKIFSTSGAWVKTIPAADGLGQWDLTNQAGQPVRAGAYVYLITDGKRTIEGKLRVSR